MNELPSMLDFDGVRSINCGGARVWPERIELQESVVGEFSRHKAALGERQLSGKQFSGAYFSKRPKPDSRALQ